MADSLVQQLTILFFLTVIVSIVILGIFFSIGCFVYAKKNGYKLPGLAFVPFYKHIYFERFGYGIMPAHAVYKAAPGVTLGLFVLTIGASFISSLAFVGVLMLFLFYRWSCFKAFYAGQGCKSVGLMSFFSLFGCSIFFLIYITVKKKKGE